MYRLSKQYILKLAECFKEAFDHEVVDPLIFDDFADDIFSLKSGLMNCSEFALLDILYALQYSEVLLFHEHPLPHDLYLVMIDIHVNLFEVLYLCGDPFLIVLDAEIEDYLVVLVLLRNELRVTDEDSLDGIESHVVTQLVWLFHFEISCEDLHLAALQAHYKREHL